MDKKLIIGNKYLDTHDKREYELTGIKVVKGEKVAILVRGVSIQEVGVDSFWKVFREI